MGHPKLAGEQLIINNHAKHIIIRTSWVYADHGKNFAKTILNLAKEKEELRIINDQFGVPTSAELISDVTALMILQFRNTTDGALYAGTYHLTSGGTTSWRGFVTFSDTAEFLYKTTDYYAPEYERCIS